MEETSGIRPRLFGETNVRQSDNDVGSVKGQRVRNPQNFTFEILEN